MSPAGRSRLDQLTDLAISRGIPLVLALVAGTLAASSEIGPTLLGANIARLSLTGYTAALIHLAIIPRSFLLHRLALVLGVAAWLGRAYGFGILATSSEGQTATVTAIWANAGERLVVALLLIGYHAHLAIQAQTREATSA